MVIIEEIDSEEQSSHNSKNSSVSSDEIENEQANSSENSSDSDSSVEVEDEQGRNSEDSSQLIKFDSIVEIEDEQAHISQNPVSSVDVEVEDEQGRNSEDSSQLIKFDSSVEIEDEQAHISQNPVSSVEMAEGYGSRDLWSNIASFLDRESLVNMMCAWRFFKEVVMGVDSDVWKNLVLKQLKMPDPGSSIVIDWKQFYTTPSFHNALDDTSLFTHFSHIDIFADEIKLIGLIRMGALYFSSNNVSVRIPTQNHMTYIEGIIPGIWIAEAYSASCPHCEFLCCEETWTCLSLRHSDLFIMEDLLELEELRREELRGLVEREVILVGGQNVNAVDYCVADGSWNEDKFLELRFKLNFHGVAIHFYGDTLQNATYAVVHSVMRNAEGQVVLILVQHLRSHKVIAYEVDDEGYVMDDEGYVMDDEDDEMDDEDDEMDDEDD